MRIGVWRSNARPGKLDAELDYCARGFETDRNFLRVGDKYLMQPIKDEWQRQSGQQHARHPTNDVSSGLAQPRMGPSLSGPGSNPLLARR